MLFTGSRDRNSGLTTEADWVFHTDALYGRRTYGGASQEKGRNV